MSWSNSPARLSFRHLRAVVAIAERRSLVGAAKDLNLTQPAVTKSLREAESILGVELFERANRGVKATPFGEALVWHAKVVLAELADAAGELVDLREGMEGRVVIGTLLTASARLLPDAIARLHRERPNLKVGVIEATNDVLVPALKLGEIDLIVGRLPRYRQRDGLVYETLLQDEACAIVRADHPLSSQRSLRLNDLLRFPWILPRMETNLRGDLERAFREAGLEPPAHAVESMSLLTNKRLLLESDYVTVWPRQVADCDDDQRLITILPLKLPGTKAAIGITTRANIPPSPTMHACFQALRDAASSISETLPR